MELEINNRKVRLFTNIWKHTSKQPLGQRRNHKISKKYLKTILWHAAKVVLIEKFIAINTLRNQKNPNKWPNFIPQGIRKKKEKLKPKASRTKETVSLGMKIKQKLEKQQKGSKKLEAAYAKR